MTGSSSEPSEHWRPSVSGMNSRVPSRVRAKVISGLVTKQWVAHVLVAGVCAGADETILDLQRPALGLGGVRQLGDGGGEVRGKGAVNMGLQSAQVNLQNLEIHWSMQNQCFMIYLVISK